MLTITANAPFGVVANDTKDDDAIARFRAELGLLFYDH